MNARIERAMNFENLVIRITENSVPDRKICALKDFKDKTIFSGGVGGYLWSF
jgi:hypothetical protein